MMANPNYFFASGDPHPLGLANEERRYTIISTPTGSNWVRERFIKGVSVMPEYKFTREQLIRLMGRAAQEASGTAWGVNVIAEQALAEFDAEDGAVRKYVMEDDYTLMKERGID